MAEFDPSMLPPLPDLIPAELRKASVDNTLGGFTRKITPAQIGMLMTWIVGTLSQPQFGLKVASEVTDTGWVITVDLPQPSTRQDVALP